MIKPKKKMVNEQMEGEKRMKGKDQLRFPIPLNFSTSRLNLYLNLFTCCVSIIKKDLRLQIKQSNLSCMLFDYALLLVTDPRVGLNDIWSFNLKKATIRLNYKKSDIWMSTENRTKYKSFQMSLTLNNF